MTLLNIIYWPNKQQREEIWRTGPEGYFHRIGKPARSKWYRNKQILSEEWYENGVPHRADGPATKQWNDIGQLIFKVWMWKGNRYEEMDHPFNVFRAEHNLSSDMKKWPDEMRVLFELIYV